MNYIINSNINFYEEINKLDEIEDNICLLSYEPLNDNYITLDCKHKFNYISLYNELCKQKSKNNLLETTHVKINEIKCPYCRTITNKILPFILNDNIEEKNGINYPSKYSLVINNCSWIYKSGKNKNCLCNSSSFIYNNNNFCLKHHKILDKKEKINNNNSYYSKEVINNYLKKYKITQLKDLLRENNLKLSGNKKELIIRLLDKKITI